jgi:hypothetical protein
MIPSLKKIRTSDADLKNVQDSLELVLNQIIRRGILDGILVENVSLVSGSNIVDHTLDRAPKGFIIVARNANQQVWNGTSTKIVPKRNIDLESSGAVTVSLWFF